MGLSVPIAFGVRIFEPDAKPQAKGPDTALLRSLCKMREQWAEGDGQAAGRTFTDELHQPLHDLAASVFDQQPAASSQVLQTKGRIERAITAKRAPSMPDVDALVSATEVALGARGVRDNGAPC